jgi:hypothetical protein
LKKNEQAFAIAERAIEEEVKNNVANIPPPPAGDLGNIMPPAGFGLAYCPALDHGLVMPSVIKTAIPEQSVS